MADKEKRPIIIVKKKIAGGGHHSGAWKVAYADFVTAMMAFFMVMWLVASVSKEQRAAMFEYFHNPSMEEGKSVKAAPGQAGPGGASTSVIDMGGGMDAPKTAPKDQDQGLGQAIDTSTVEEARRIAQEAEKKQLESLMQELKEAIDKSQALQPFKDQLLLDITPEGLRIQIVDKQNRPMFDLGKSNLKDYTTEILREVAKYLNTVPNRISLSGHTDHKPYAGTRGYTNWELSADRANAARRALLDGGLQEQKIARVVGLASSVLFDRENPYNPINRRISIIVMTRSAEATALSTDAPDVEAAREAIESGKQLEAPPEGAPTGVVPAAGAANVAAVAPPAPLPPPVRVSTVSAGAAAKAAEAALSKGAMGGTPAH
jgi:chemotaxis protein MotB